MIRSLLLSFTLLLYHGPFASYSYPGTLEALSVLFLEAFETVLEAAIYRFL